MIVCGLDECGRGALAGPLVAAAVVFANESSSVPHKLKDSKALTPLKRHRLYKRIMRLARRVEIEIITARQINNQGMGWANKEIFKRLIKRIEADKYIVDGNLVVKVNSKSNRIQTLIKADTKVPEVMAASIVAKVTRDKLMKELHQTYPKYGWQTNVGYGTAYHLAALGEYGMIRYHRSVFVTTALRGQASDNRE